jgi:hypothetical protein
MAGLGPAPAIEQVESVSLAKEFPFLGEKAADDQGWRVQLAMTKLPWPEKLPGRPDAYQRRCTVFLDAGAERILAITARAVEPSAGPAAMPAKADRALLTRMSGAGPFSKDLSPFSKLSPKLTWMDALVGVCHGGAGYPPNARDIDAYYLQCVESGRPERPVWLFDLHGLPGGPMSHPVLSGPIVSPKPSVKRFSHACILIDATTGELLYPMTQDTPDDRFPSQEQPVKGAFSLDSLHPKFDLRSP